MANPQTHYAKTDDGAHIAYQVVGNGPIDLLFIPWWWNHLESLWTFQTELAVPESVWTISSMTLVRI